MLDKEEIAFDFLGECRIRRGRDGRRWILEINGDGD
jgi:hypothetical protein